LVQQQWRDACEAFIQSWGMQSTISVSYEQPWKEKEQAGECRQVLVSAGEKQRTDTE
jgi:hypothetical protein